MLTDASAHRQIDRLLYLCEVTVSTRAANIAAGWQHARDLGLTISNTVGSKSVRT